MITQSSNSIFWHPLKKDYKVQNDTEAQQSLYVLIILLHLYDNSAQICIAGVR